MYEFLLAHAHEKKKLESQLAERTAELAIVRSQTPQLPAARSQQSDENWHMYGTFGTAAPTSDFKLDKRNRKT